MEYFYLILIGVFGGFLAGMLGVGGGVIYILVLPVIFENLGVCDKDIVPMVVANSIFASVIASFSANIKLILNKTIEYRTIIWTALTGSISAILVMTFIVESEWYSKTVFNIVATTFILFMLFRLFFKSENEYEETEISIPKLLLIGVFAGLVSSLSGLGGGVIIVPLFTVMFNMKVFRSKTISLGIIGLMSLVFSIRNFFGEVDCTPMTYQIGLIDLFTVGFISLGVLIGTPFGVKVSEKVSGYVLKIAFSLMLIIAIIDKSIEIYLALN